MPLKSIIPEVIQQYLVIGFTTVSATISGLLFLDSKFVPKPQYELHLKESKDSTEHLKASSKANKRAVQELHLQVVVSSLNNLKVKPEGLREPWERLNLLRLEAERDKIIRDLQSGG